MKIYKGEQLFGKDLQETKNLISMTMGDYECIDIGFLFGLGV